MSLISGSNSLTPAIAGALDLRATIVEKALLEEAVGCGFKVCSEYNGGFVEVFPHKQREKDAWCCSCRIAVRLTVLRAVDMSEALTGHNIVFKDEKTVETIGLHMRLAME